MSEPSVLAALGPVLDVLESLGVRYFVGGSLASSAHGVPRTSIDADLVAALRPDQAGALAKALQDTYYVSEERARDAVARRSSFNLIHLATMFKVDVFVAKDREFERSAFARARQEPLTGDQGRRVPVASAEDIVLAKLEWYRKGGEVSERQWNDVLGVLRVAAARLDVGYLKDRAPELGVTDLVERALREAA